MAMAHPLHRRARGGGGPSSGRMFGTAGRTFMSARRYAEAACGRRTAIWTSQGDMLMTRTSLLRRGLPGLLAALALAAVPAAASADGLNVALSGCPTQPTSHPFAGWLDGSSYVLAP